DRLAEIDEAARLEPCGARDRHRDGQHPHAHSPPVAADYDVGHRTHGAEVDPIRDGAEHESEAERAPGDQYREVLQVLHAVASRCGAPGLFEGAELSHALHPGPL